MQDNLVRCISHIWYDFDSTQSASHDDVIKWKHFPRNWPFVRGIHRSPVNSPYKGQWSGALMFSLICVWMNGWVNNHEAGDLRRHRAHYVVKVMLWLSTNNGRHCNSPICHVTLVSTPAITSTSDKHNHLKMNKLFLSSSHLLGLLIIYFWLPHLCFNDDNKWYVLEIMSRDNEHI